MAGIKCLHVVEVFWEWGLHGATDPSELVGEAAALQVDGLGVDTSVPERLQRLVAVYEDMSLIIRTGFPSRSEESKAERLVVVRKEKSTVSGT